MSNPTGSNSVPSNSWWSTVTSYLPSKETIAKTVTDNFPSKATVHRVVTQTLPTIGKEVANASKIFVQSASPNYQFPRTNNDNNNNPAVPETMSVLPTVKEVVTIVGAPLLVPKMLVKKTLGYVTAPFNGAIKTAETITTPYNRAVTVLSQEVNQGIQTINQHLGLPEQPKSARLEDKKSGKEEEEEPLKKSEKPKETPIVSNPNSSLMQKIQQEAQNALETTKLMLKDEYSDMVSPVTDTKKRFQQFSTEQKQMVETLSETVSVVKKEFKEIQENLTSPVPSIPPESAVLLEMSETLKEEGTYAEIPVKTEKTEKKSTDSSQRIQFTHFLTMMKNLIARTLLPSNGMGSFLVSGIVSSLKWGIDQVKKSLPTGDENHRLLDQLKNSLDRLQTEGKFQQIPQIIDEWLKNNQVHLYFNDIHLAGHNPSETDAEQNNDDLFSIDAAKAIDYKREIQREKQKAVDLAARFGPVKFIYEFIADMPKQPDEFYKKLITDSAGNLETAFFKLLDDANLFFLVRWIAKAAYWILSSFAPHYLKVFADSALEATNDYVDQNDKEGFRTALTKNLQDTNAFLEVFIGAFKRVAEQKDVNGNIINMLQEELAKPSINDGMTPKEIYDATANKAVNQFIPKLGWGGKIQSSFNSLRISDQSFFRFMNIPIALIMHTLAFTLRALIIVPEWLFDHLISWILKSILIKTELVDTLLDKGIKAIQDNNGFSYAMLCTLNEFLDDIWKDLQEVTANPSLMTEMSKESMANQEELQRNVKLIMEAVSLNKCDTMTELQKFINGHYSTMVERGLQEIDQFFTKETAEGITDVLSIAYKRIMSKDFLQQKIYQFFHMINENFKDTSGAVSEEEFMQVEQSFVKKVDRILTFAIYHSIAQKFDPDKLKKIESQTNEMIEKVSKELKTTIEPLTQLSSEEELSEETLNSFIEQVHGTRQTNIRYIQETQGNQLYDNASKDIIIRMIEKQNQSLSAIEAEFRGMLPTSQREESDSSEDSEDVENSLYTTRLRKIVDQANAMQAELESLKPMNYINLGFLNFNFVRDGINKLAFNRIKESVESFLGLIRSQGFYWGMFHRMLLLPFLKG